MIRWYVRGISSGWAGVVEWHPDLLEKNCYYFPRWPDQRGVTRFSKSASGVRDAVECGAWREAPEMCPDLMLDAGI